MVKKNELARIRCIVEGAYQDHFGAHQTDLMLEARVDHNGYDVVDVVFVFDEEPPGLGGRKTLDFKGQVNDQMVEDELLIDLIFEFHLRSELEETMAEQAAW
ncbi:MAG: hypothetical protein F4106_05660 [Gemmatimonadetes bacterium]|nr:hypothetical protein [Gemmatimonadota bacterium]MYC90799.1 hypothetical protein [Gemmatimonadota bacterium]MYG34418.1 hypothetical protein [Gemmatimonadota bacterium]MYJ17522.1 hypothetical protein [Gemmatimonadota bacterium]